MPSVLLVPDLPLERWASMDKYAHRLHDWLESSELGFQVRLAAHIGALTRDSVGRRGSTAEHRGDRRKAFVRWWSQPVDPSRVILPGPFHGPQQWAARYYFYPWRVKREAKRVDLVHVLDHSYAHMIETAGRRPVVVTVHDLMPVVVLRSPTDGWREGVRNRFLRQALKALRQGGADNVGAPGGGAGGGGGGAATTRTFPSCRSAWIAPSSETRRWAGRASAGGATGASRRTRLLCSMSEV